MADRIITLKDDDNNPTYPIAGGMMADSVTTAMLKDDSVTTAKIADGAVTSQKIDWATTETVYSTANKPSSVTLLTVDIHVVSDPNGKYATIWGRTETTSTVSTESVLTIQTDLRPSSNIDITPCGFVAGVNGDGRINSNMGVATLKLNTSGMLSIRNINWSDTTSNNRCRTWMFPVTIYL